MDAKHTPRVVDNDRDEITVTLDGKQLRGWSYATEAERRTKMLAAREFCEGWHAASERSGIDATLYETCKAHGLTAVTATVLGDLRQPKISVYVHWMNGATQECAGCIKTTFADAFAGALAEMTARQSDADAASIGVALPNIHQPETAT